MSFFAGGGGVCCVLSYRRSSTTELSADSYQYQLQSMWQKCWNTNQSLVHNLRFRERGPLKSWRPETMAEAIFSVLKEGLSLSQAARKFDIPYPTFVLYANRVHNMLGPSADGGADLRPKGRGRPQRILLGVWPDEHIRGVIRAVVFRDPQHMKDDQHLGFPRIPQDTSYLGNACGNNPDPSQAAIAAVAVAGLRQQVCNMVAAAHHHGDTGFVNSLNLLSHCNNLGLPTNGIRLNSPLGSAHDLRINSPGSREVDLSPASSPCNPLDGCAVNLSTTNVNCKSETKPAVRSDSKSPPTEDYEVNLSTRHLSKSPSEEYDDIDDLVRSPRGLETSETVVRDTSMPLKVEITE
ncbi:hypothetical protein RUM43_002368 [Polyplax serrata]|uniref:HTH psq-type domain-containing protein n=1 Tax=Polyplax serrata TaxID=468196 RepID=A0AAN8RVV6_POLSC